MSADAAPFVHWGATTQDIMDTACVLQLRAAIKLFKTRLGEVVRHLSALAGSASKYDPAARTHGQQALPVTFGLKVANWLAPLVRHLQRLEEIQPRLLVVQFGGAAGTLAALGDKGLAVAEELAKELKLGVPAMPWHAQRDSLVEFASWLEVSSRERSARWRRILFSWRKPRWVKSVNQRRQGAAAAARCRRRAIRSPAS